MYSDVEETIANHHARDLLVGYDQPSLGLFRESLFRSPDLSKLPGDTHLGEDQLGIKHGKSEVDVRHQARARTASRLRATEQ